MYTYKIHSVISHFVRVTNITQAIITMHAWTVKIDWLFQPINGHLC